LNNTIFSFLFRLRCFFLIAVLFSAVVFTGTAVDAANKGIFINKCGQCHHTGGQAMPVNPADKAGLVWIKYFKRQRHPVDLTQMISSEEMQAILQYLQDHAADSERPVAAAIPK
jgi:cytochrome c553